jgi:hypothetical protein
MRTPTTAREMTINQMQVIRKKRGLLNVDNPTKNKESKEEKKSTENKENTSKNVQIQFIKTKIQ